MRPINITLNCNIGALTIPAIAFLAALFFGVYEADDMRKRAEGEPAAQPTEQQPTQGQETETNNADQQ